MKIKPIIENFIAAGRLINEWRDTLCYGASTVVAVYFYAQGVPLGLSVGFMGLMGLQRELLRSCFWLRTDEEQFVGQARPINNNQMKWASTAGSCAHCTMAGFAVTAYCVGNPSLMSSSTQTCLIGAATLLTSLSRYRYKFGPVKGILADYKNVMFDYPRKRDGGTSQTQQIVNWWESKRALPALPSATRSALAARTKTAAP